MISSGCSMFQPVEKNVKTWTYLDLDAPAMRIAHPVPGVELLQKVKNVDGTESWVNIGVGTLPAGAYIKGRAPSEDVKDLTK